MTFGVSPEDLATVIRVGNKYADPREPEQQTCPSCGQGIPVKQNER